MPKVVQYRNKCIGCGICQERQPELWRMSKKDGKATLLGAAKKKDTYVLAIPAFQQADTEAVASVCPVKIIKVG